MHVCFSVFESITQKQRDLLDIEYMEMMNEQDPEVYPGFHEGDMAGITTDEVCSRKTMLDLIKYLL